MTAEDFMDSDLRSVWITERFLKAYIRKATRLLGSELKTCIDIGSIEVAPSHRGKKIFTNFIQRIESLARLRNASVFVESIREPRLFPFLENRGYEYCERSNRQSMFLNPQPVSDQELLIDLSRRFIALIDHPSPGIGSWHVAVQSIVNQIAEVSAKLKSK